MTATTSTHYTAPPVPPLDVEAMKRVQNRLDALTKPRGSLGRLEALAAQLAGIAGRVPAAFPAKTVLLMAADHGVVEEGVSAYPQQVTQQMVLNFLKGGAAINVLARMAGARVVIVDMGVVSALPPNERLVQRRIRGGTANMVAGPAMSRDEAVAAIEAGYEIGRQEIARGAGLLATGDMGIGNTTAASAITAVLTHRQPREVTGRGAGLDDAGLARKLAVVEQAIRVNQPDPGDLVDVLTKVGGLEIAGLVGVILGSAAGRVPVLLDGFISGAAALVAAAICPNARNYLIAAHRSAEPGHRVVLDALDLRPLLDLELRLGEGTGAVLAMPLIDAALAILNEMATFEEAGVANRTDGA